VLVDFVGVDLDREFRMIAHWHGVENGFGQFRDHRGGQERRRATAPVQP